MNSATGPWLDEPECAPSAGTVIEHPKGYLRVWLGKRHPHADRSGYAMLHRLVAAYQLGRQLLTSEHVHHEDEDKTNNRPENLRVYDCAYHGRLHASSVEVANADSGQLGEIAPLCIMQAWRDNG
jgi:hypothetical protein